MPPYNAALERQLETYRKNKRVIVARNINFQATPAEFEAAFRAKLSDSNSATFLWPPATEKWRLHAGYAYAYFAGRPETQTALRDLGESFEFRKRQVKIEAAHRVVRPPRSQRNAAASAASSTAATTATPMSLHPAPETTSARPALYPSNYISSGTQTELTLINVGPVTFNIIPATTAPTNAAPTGGVPTNVAPTNAVSVSDEMAAAVAQGNDDHSDYDCDDTYALRWGRKY